MSDFSDNINEQDLGLGGQNTAPPELAMQWATVGWTSESGAGAADHADAGSPNNDGTTLVKITTFAGRAPGVSPKPGQAQGNEYLAQVLGPIFRIPQKGERVLVAFPSGMEQTPGAAVILGTMGGGAETKRNMSPGDVAITASGGGSASLVVKANGNVSLFTTSDNTNTGKTIALTLKPGGLSFVSPYGSIGYDASGFHVKTKAGPRLDMGGINIPGLSSLGAAAAAFTTYATLSAGIVRAAGGTVFLGAGSLFNSALNAVISPTPPLPPNGVTAVSQVLQSQTVYMAP